MSGPTRVRAIATVSAKASERVAFPLRSASRRAFSDSAMILFAASATLDGGVSAHAFRTARMPRTLNEPVLRDEPAGFAARRFQIDVLWIAKKLDRRGAEQNHAPSVNGVGEMNETAFGIDVA